MAAVGSTSTVTLCFADGSLFVPFQGEGVARRIFEKAPRERFENTEEWAEGIEGAIFEEIRLANDLKTLQEIRLIFSQVKQHCENPVLDARKKRYCIRTIDVLTDFTCTKQASVAARLGLGIITDKPYTSRIAMKLPIGTIVVPARNAYSGSLPDRIQKATNLEELDDYFALCFGVQGFCVADNILLNRSIANFYVHAIDDCLNQAKQKQAALIVQLGSAQIQAAAAAARPAKRARYEKR